MDYLSSVFTFVLPESFVLYHTTRFKDDQNFIPKLKFSVIEKYSVSVYALVTSI